MAAAMLFTAVFIMISGVQIISTRVLDGRRTLVIGMGMMSFFVVSVYPAVFTSAPQWAQPLVTSPLVLATLVALSLNPDRSRLSQSPIFGGVGARLRSAFNPHRSGQGRCANRASEVRR